MVLSLNLRAMRVVFLLCSLPSNNLLPMCHHRDAHSSRSCRSACDQGSSVHSRQASQRNAFQVLGGPSWTPVNPSTVNNFRDAAGLPNAYNLGRFVSVGKIYDLSGIIIKSADEIPPNTGGLLEYKFIDPARSAMQIILQDVFGVNPPY